MAHPLLWYASGLTSEFCNVARMDPRQRSFWEQAWPFRCLVLVFILSLALLCFGLQVSRKLPTMPHSEAQCLICCRIQETVSCFAQMTLRVAHLFPSTYDERTHKLC